MKIELGEYKANPDIVALGDCDARVAPIQRMLAELGFSTPNNGEFDTKTESAVKAFQSSVSLPSTGVVDQKTFAALKDEPSRRAAKMKPIGDQKNVALKNDVKPNSGKTETDKIKQDVNKDNEIKTGKGEEKKKKEKPSKVKSEYQLEYEKLKALFAQIKQGDEKGVSIAAGDVTRSILNRDKDKSEEAKDYLYLLLDLLKGKRIPNPTTNATPDGKPPPTAAPPVATAPPAPPAPAWKTALGVGTVITAIVLLAKWFESSRLNGAPISDDDDENEE